MFPNRVYTEWLTDEIVKMNKLLRESQHEIDDINNKPSKIFFEMGYSKALIEFINDLREILNYGEEDN